MADSNTEFSVVLPLQTKEDQDCALIFTMSAAEVLLRTTKMAKAASTRPQCSAQPICVSGQPATAIPSKWSLLSANVLRHSR